MTRLGRTGVASLAWLVAWSFLAVASLGRASEHQLPLSLFPPSAGHILGYDAFGRDLLTLTPLSSVYSMAFALLTVIASVTAGLLFGTSITVAPKPVRFALERVLDFFLAFPSLLLALTWSALHGPGWDTLLVSLALGTVPGFTRLVSVRAKELMAEEYVVAAQSLGAGTFRILSRHLAPGIFSLCAVKTPTIFAHALMAEATLSFLGVGAPIGRDTWGTLLAQGKDYLLEAPHIALAAGTPLILTILCLQLLSSRVTER